MIKPPAYYQNILQTIGNTPLVRLKRITKELPCTVYAKLESYNPGLSAKDRIALMMIQDAQYNGTLKPGGIVIETTSGNTGYSAAMICAVLGYKCILSTNTKISQEKLLALKSLGAQVIINPAEVPAEHPDSYYSVAKKIHTETPNSIYLNQYYNLENTKAHYRSTGPEIWNQTQGRITHYIAACGTGGTLCGTGAFLKKMNPQLQLIGIDAYGSVLKKYHETGIFDSSEIYPYKLEAVGKNIIPGNVNFDIIDQFVKVHDEPAANQARRLAKQEGILAGYSAGAVVQGLFNIAEQLNQDHHIVLLFSDHGSKYFGKIFDDSWMEQQNFNITD